MASSSSGVVSRLNEDALVTWRQGIKHSECASSKPSGEHSGSCDVTWTALISRCLRVRGAEHWHMRSFHSHCIHKHNAKWAWSMRVSLLNGQKTNSYNTRTSTSGGDYTWHERSTKQREAHYWPVSTMTSIRSMLLANASRRLMWWKETIEPSRLARSRASRRLRAFSRRIWFL